MKIEKILAITASAGFFLLNQSLLRAQETPVPTPRATAPSTPGHKKSTKEEIKALEDQNESLEERIQALEDKVTGPAFGPSGNQSPSMNTGSEKSTLGKSMGNQGSWPDEAANPASGMQDAFTYFRNGVEYVDIASEANHLIFQDATGTSEFRIGGYMFADYHYFWQPNTSYLLNDYIKQPEPATPSEQKDYDGFLARKAHLDFGGRFNEMFGMSIGIESDKSTAVSFGVFHAYVYAKLDKALVITAGKFANILSLEGLQPSDDLPFLEASMLSNLAVNKDIGILVSGELFNKFMDYGLELANGQQDNESSATFPGEADQNSKAFTGRLFFTPWSKSGDVWLEGLGFGAAGSYDNETNALTRGSGEPAENNPWAAGFATSLGGNEFAFDGGTGGTGAFAAGPFYHLDGQFYYYQGPFGLQGEWIQSTETVGVEDQPTIALTNQAWLLEGTWVFGGEAGFEGPHVDEPFDFKTGKLGALEIVARVDQLMADVNAFTVGFPYDPAGSSLATGAQVATAFGVGANWWFTPNFKWMLDFERTQFSGGNMPVPPEQVIF